MKVNTGTPTKNGMYVAYIDPITEGFSYPDKELLMFVQGEWGHRGSDTRYRGTVYGWIGPLPMPKILDLIEPEENEVVFAIAFKKNGKWNFVNGPNPSMYSMTDSIGDKGEYIVALQRDEEPKPLFRWNNKQDKWRLL